MRANIALIRAVNFHKVAQNASLEMAK